MRHRFIRPLGDGCGWLFGVVLGLTLLLVSPQSRRWGRSSMAQTQKRY